MAQLARRDSDIVLVGMILLIAAAVGQSLVQGVRGTRYSNVIVYPGTVLFFADLALVAGQILIALGLYRLIRRVESRLLL